MSDEERRIIAIHEEVTTIMEEITKGRQFEPMSGQQLYDETMQLVEQYFAYVKKKELEQLNSESDAAIDL